MVMVPGGLAEFERELIRARTGEGRTRAKAYGVKCGRPRKLTAHQRQEAIARLTAGETQADVARTYNAGATTIGRFQTALSYPPAPGARSPPEGIPACGKRRCRMQDLNPRPTVYKTAIRH